MCATAKKKGRRSRRTLATTGLCLLVAGVGCEGPSTAPHEADAQWLAFKAAAVKLEDEPRPVYMFGGDMVAVGTDGLYREYLRYFSPPPSNGVRTTKSSLTVDHVAGEDILLDASYGDSDGGRFDLTYCIEENSFTAEQFARLEDALEIATRSWSDVVNVRFRYVPGENATCDRNNTNVFFNVSSANLLGTARAFFPDIAREDRQLQVDDIAFTTTVGGRDLQGIMRHEVGHILGFRHEHIWIACTIESVGDGRRVTDYDEDSVMHYPQCRSMNAGGYRQTARDYQGAAELYGLSAAVTSVIGS